MKKARERGEEIERKRGEDEEDETIGLCCWSGRGMQKGRGKKRRQRGREEAARKRKNWQA